MDYYKLLGLNKEPFSTSPDPDFFYRSISHDTAIKRLEIAIRLRRGLSIIIGDIGAGKTTLSRALAQNLGLSDEFIFRVIFDPGFKTEQEFLLRLAASFQINVKSDSIINLKESIERYLFCEAARKNKTIILLIDEGQKLSLQNIETLRVLLNYETNSYKLLQVAVLGQPELTNQLKSVPNFTERAALKYTISPLDKSETGAMINFRLTQAGFRGDRDIFLAEALDLIYRHSLGCPRKITMLCHDALEKLITHDKEAVDAAIVEELINEKIIYGYQPCAGR